MAANESSMDRNEKYESLVEEREVEDMVGIKRKGWFLKPILDSNSAPSAHGYHQEAITPAVEIPSKAVFKGWANPQRQWSRWVDKLKPVYLDLWERVGISDAILVSTYAIRKDPSSIWGLVSFWNGETNTFFFPWGEATVTLEDVMVLGGLSVTGEPVRLRSPLEGELREMEFLVMSEMRKFNEFSTRKAEISTWLKHYMRGGNADEFEHVAFLVLWLSRYVFPSHPMETVKLNVIHIAIRLARGVRIALAPAVLASLYRDLRMMKDYLGGSGGSHDSLCVWAPFCIHQLWVWERFLVLGPVPAETSENDAPRAARWNKVGRSTDFSFVISILQSSENFKWRPYVAGYGQWRKPTFYSKDNGEYWIHCNNEIGDEELGAFARCLRACELVGLTCVEQYLPHRVAMQFGLDQDIPQFVPRVDSTWESAWQTYDISRKNVEFFVPSRLSEPDVTLRYSVWWKKNVQRLIQQKKIELEKKRKAVLCLLQEKQKKMKEIQEEFDDLMPSNRLGNKILSISTPRENQVVPVTLNLFPGGEIAQGEEFASDPMEMENKFMGGINKTGARESFNNPIMIDEVHENSEMGAKDSEYQLEVLKLQEDIASVSGNNKETRIPS